MNNKQEPTGYIALWTLVIIWSIILIVFFGFYKVGAGRWVCTEYSAVCNKCDVVNYNGSIVCQCLPSDMIKICTKEVWTRVINLGDD